MKGGRLAEGTVSVLRNDETDILSGTSPNPGVLRRHLRRNKGAGEGARAMREPTSSIAAHAFHVLPARLELDGRSSKKSAGQGTLCNSPMISQWSGLPATGAGRTFEARGCGSPTTSLGSDSTDSAEDPIGPCPGDAPTESTESRGRLAQALGGRVVRYVVVVRAKGVRRFH